MWSIGKISFLIFAITASHAVQAQAGADLDRPIVKSAPTIRSEIERGYNAGFTCADIGNIDPRAYCFKTVGNKERAANNFPWAFFIGLEIHESESDLLEYKITSDPGEVYGSCLSLKLNWIVARDQAREKISMTEIQFKTVSQNLVGNKEVPIEALVKQDGLIENGVDTACTIKTRLP